MRGILIITLFISTLSLAAQNRIGTGEIADLYQQYCMACHGANLEGGLGVSLVDDSWIHGGGIEDIKTIIREGVMEKGMVPYEGVLSDEQIHAMAIYIVEMGQLAVEKGNSPQKQPEDGQYTSEHHSFSLEKVYELDGDIFWSVSFLPDGAMLLSGFGGKLYVARDGKLGDPIEGIPEVHRHGQGGLLESQAHPDYEDNGWIYLGYTEKSTDPESGDDQYMTAIARGKIVDGKWVENEDIFRVPPEFHRTSGPHFGTRFVFQDGYLFFSIGDRGAMDHAQDLSRPNGKIHRIHDDGRIPKDNPFVDVEDAYPSIWSYGHRNPQGLDQHPVTGEIWETEHGPRGGDELNHIHKGLNYGWPVISYGINYNGKPITDKTAAPGMEQPIHYWTPSIAVCGIDFYEGNQFPKWKNNLFVSGLSSEHLERFKLDGDRIVEHEVILSDLGRVRDVSTGPDGTLYLILNGARREGPSAIYRLVPAN